MARKVSNKTKSGIFAAWLISIQRRLKASACSTSSNSLSKALRSCSKPGVWASLLNLASNSSRALSCRSKSWRKSSMRRTWFSKLTSAANKESVMRAIKEAVSAEPKPQLSANVVSMLVLTLRSRLACSKLPFATFSCNLDKLASCSWASSSAIWLSTCHCSLPISSTK